MTVGVAPDQDPGLKRNFIYWKKRLFANEQLNMRERILERAGYSEEENLDIYEKYFKFMPNRLSYSLSKYGLGQARVLDIGCGRGEFLVHFGAGSVGLDSDPERAEFLRRLGIEIVEGNFEDDISVPDGTFDAVWCTDVLEHVLSPHLLLRRAHQKLKEHGLLFIGIPTVPSSRIVEKIIELAVGWAGYKTMEHINGFTRRTAEFTIERAQFDLLESGVFITHNRFANRALSPVLNNLTGQTLIIARKSTTRERPLTYAPAWAAEHM